MREAAAGGRGFSAKTRPCSAVYVTFEPSASDLKPLPLMPVWWTKRSLPGSSGVMKPNPLSSLNHFTVPVAMFSSTAIFLVTADAEVLVRQRLRRGTYGCRARRST
jgi:hypothetical protein